MAKKQYNPTLDLSKVIDYLWKDEEKHYEESEDKKGHIFKVLTRLRSWLINECGAIMDKVHTPKECAICGEEANRWIAIGKYTIYFCTDCIEDGDEVSVQLNQQQLKAEIGVYECRPGCPECNSD